LSQPAPLIEWCEIGQRRQKSERVGRTRVQTTSLMISCKLGLSFNGQQGEPKSVGRQVLAAGFIAAGIIDGARLILNSHEGRVDLFALRVDADRSGYFDNNPSRSRETVWGMYTTFH